MPDLRSAMEDSSVAMELTDEQRGELIDALQESVEIARLLRERIADEDSIVLLQDLERIAALLGISLPHGPSLAGPDLPGPTDRQSARV